MIKKRNLKFYINNTRYVCIVDVNEIRVYKHKVLITRIKKANNHSPSEIRHLLNIYLGLVERPVDLRDDTFYL